MLEKGSKNSVHDTTIAFKYT